MRRKIDIPGSDIGVVVVDGEIGDHCERLISRLDFRVRVSRQQSRSPLIHSTRFGMEDDELIDRIRGIVEELFPDARYAHANLTLTTHGDLPPLHVDSLSSQEQIPVYVTALCYVNAEWRPEWHGETLFYAAGEPVAVVLPRPGRVVVFDGTLQHCGTGPARNCYAPRLAVAAVFGRKDASR